MKPSDYVRKGWCQCAAATDYLGHPTTIDANDAARWCISGAIHIAYRHNPVLAQKTIYEATRALQANARELNEGIQTLQRWNDSRDRTKDEVLALLRSIGE